jgi:putative sugar O-methyltransferase
MKRVAVDDASARVIRRIDELGQTMASKEDVYGPAHFWKVLGEKHTDQIGRYGFEQFKRTVNFEYNQWGVTSVKNGKIRKLLKQLLSRRQLPISLLRTSCDRREMANVRWPDELDVATGEGKLAPSRRWAIEWYRVYVALLWQFAQSEDDLGCLKRWEEPHVGSPLPLTYSGRKISQDLAMSSLELNFVARHVPLEKVRRVGEIGAGYGRFADLYLKMFPSAEYHIYDIPPALAISENYLRLTAGEGRVKTDLPHVLDEMSNGYFDLFMNVSSFDEMASEQVRHYLKRIDEKVSGWLYLKGCARTQSRGDRMGIEQFPIPARWKLVVSRPDPVVNGFIERIYSLHG